jgi:hypothetical protein
MSENIPPETAPVEIEQLTNLVNEILAIEEIKLGGSQDPFLVQYRGQLTQSSESAYDLISQSLIPLQVTPLFRSDQGRDLVIIRPGIIQATPSRKGINVLLFVITFISILFAGIITSYTGPLTTNLKVIWFHLKSNLGPAFAFAVSMFSILSAHEFGHYFAARYHKTRVTLPYFIPLPISPIGTMGAFIRMLEPPKNKKVLLDIGLAGPLAGLVIALPVLVLGLSISTVEALPSDLSQGIWFEGNSILYLGLKYLVHGSMLPEPASFQGLPRALYWLRFFFTGFPLPTGGRDVLLHPVAWAGWSGLFITSLNLIPAGQLDGGHLINSLAGNKGKWIRPAVLICLTVLGFMWSGWWLWALIIFFLGNFRAEALDEITEINPIRKNLARFGLLIFLLIFMPVPLINI